MAGIAALYSKTKVLTLLLVRLSPFFGARGMIDVLVCAPPLAALEHVPTHASGAWHFPPFADFQCLYGTSLTFVWLHAPT
jgi:hypothetical protein